MSTAPTSTRRKRRQLLRVAILASFIAGAVLVRAYRRDLRAERLAAEIKEAGGTVSRAAPVWERLWWRVRNSEHAHFMRSRMNGDETIVRLPKTLKEHWLESRDYLDALSITELEIISTPESAEIPLLVARHPLKSLTVSYSRGVDNIAAALSDKRMVRRFAAFGSDLSDAGLKHLPLEQIEDLQIAKTRVTATGLLELHRAKQLHAIMLDGQQIDADVAFLLEENAAPYLLMLRGYDVQDLTLQMLMSVLKQRPKTTMDTLFLDDTSATEAGVSAWERGLPSIGVVAPEIRSYRTPQR